MHASGVGACVANNWGAVVILTLAGATVIGIGYLLSRLFHRLWPGPQARKAASLPPKSRQERLADIDAFHQNELNALEVRLSECKTIPGSVLREAGRQVQGQLRFGQVNVRTGNSGLDVGLAVGSMINGAIYSETSSHAVASAVIRKTLRDMDDSERATLRLGDVLHAIGALSDADLERIKVPVAWSGGRCVLAFGRDYTGDKRNAYVAAVNTVMTSHFGDSGLAAEILQAALRDALAPGSSLSADDRNVLERYLYAGSRWMSPHQAARSNSRSALKLGLFEGTEIDLEYDRRESLITIAPPGSGKSQAHVMRNLLSMRAPAIVLDIKGEAFLRTARWRKENVGDVFAFAPTLPNVSMHYNPLDGIRSSEEGWDDARNLADLLFVPTKTDPYFENRARDLVTGALLDVAVTEPAGRRNMESVIDRLYLSDEEFVDWMAHLESSGLPILKRQANAWKAMPRKQREAVFDSARNHLEAWQSPALAPLLDRSDWHPQDLRAKNATLYLCVNLEDVKKYAGVLRVIIGQTIAALCRGEAETNAPIITFFLDELPRLGRLDVIEEGLDFARGHGVRFWLFCQNLGQLRTAYRNADGILANCAVRCFMDPDDETAEELERHLGQRKGLIDGRQKPLVEASELKGPDFADKIIVFSRGGPPAKLVRRMAFAEPRLAGR
jgi:type IV secretion system protein VirD4